MTQTTRTSQLGSAAASLFVAYMLVLQGLAAGLSLSAARGEAGFLGNVVCLEKNEGRPSSYADPLAPGPKRNHGVSCCVLHCSGAGAPPLSSYVEELRGAFPVTVAWPGLDERSATLQWPTLPLGSRAPPQTVS